MKKSLLFVILAITLMLLWSGCDNWVTSIDPLTGQVQDDQLNNEGSIPFLITGVWGQLASCTDGCFALSDLLSDQLLFDLDVPLASYSQYEEIDTGDILLDNNSVEGVYNAVMELRFLADDVVRRAGDINFSDTDLEKEVNFTGYFLGGISRYYLATYFGLDKNQGGSPLDKGPMISSDELYNQAIDYLTKSIEYAEDDYMIRVIKTIIARIYLYKKDYTNAKQYANEGLAQGDDPYQVPYNVADNTNYYWQQAGLGRSQMVIDFRFHDYVTEDPAEMVRVSHQSIIGRSGAQWWLQTKYDEEGDPLNLTSWQENELMLAELEVREGNTGSALTRVNEIRTSHGLDPLDAVDLNTIIEERDKELFLTGMRLADERRFDIWHMDADTWHYLPVTQAERNSNPNID